MDKRRKDIADEIAQAEKIKEEAEAKVEEEQEKVARLTEEVKGRVAELEEEKIVAQSEREALLAQARLDAEKIKVDAQREANEERQKAVQNAKNDVADLAVNVAKAILEREITAKDDEKLIDECIKDMKND
jgi:F-type H+-transporting ATPase subunit b